MSTRVPEPGADVAAWEKAVLALLGAAVTLALCLLAGGATAALLTGGGWVWPPASQAARVVGRLLEHPADPGLAYKAPLAERMPGPVPFWGITGGVLAAAVISVVLLVVAVLQQRTGDGMATRTELRTASRNGNSCPHPFATYRGAGVRAQREDSAIVIAPSRAGKTTSLAAPLVADAAGPVVATSTKVDLLHLTVAARAVRGPVWVWDADAISDWPHPAQWDVVRGCADVREASGRAKAMVAARPLGQARNTGFFAGTAETVLRCLLHAAALSDGSMRQVVAWARDFSIDAPYAVLRDHPAAAPGWFDDLRKYCRSGAPETISSTDMSLGLVLGCLADPRVLNLVCPAAGGGINLDDLVQPDALAPGTLYVLCEGGSGGSTAPLATALISAVVRAGRRASQTRPDGRLDPTCTFVLDEAPNVAPIPEMPMLLSDGGGRGLPAWVFAQSFGQLRARWGRDEADTMWGSAPIKLVLGGASETDDLERLSKLLGERRVRRVTTSRSQGSSWSRQVGTERERVLPIEAIRGLPVGQGLLLYRSLPPAVVDLQPWWERRDADDFRRPAAGAT